MGRKQKIKKGAIDIADIINDVARPEFIIMDAKIHDDYCHYGYEVTGEIGRGDYHSVKGTGIVKDDMKNAYQKFNVHMAFIDGVFGHKGIEVEDIDRLHDHEVAFDYTVTGFKIKGSGDNEAIVLIGKKYVNSVKGYIELVTPKIALDSLSSYVWYNELKAAADNARQEVALYKNGKYDVPEPEKLEAEAKKQTKITFASDQGAYAPLSDEEFQYNDGAEIEEARL